MARFKEFNTSTDKNIGLTAVTTNISATLPGTYSPNGPTTAIAGETGILIPPGYKRLIDGEVIGTSSFFTFSTASQIVDIAYGIRSGCFDDSTSMFYQTNTGWRNDSTSAGGFTTIGLDAFATSSMVYASTADYLNDGEAFKLDDKKIDLLGILNFKRSSYREELKEGSFTLSARPSGSGPLGTPNYGTHYKYTSDTNFSPTVVGRYSNVKSADGTKVGGIYYDYGIAIFDIFKLFFTSSTDRLVSNRSRLMSCLTGSPSDSSEGDVNVEHGLAFFSGSRGNRNNYKRAKYYNRVAAAPPNVKNLLNFYSGSYSQSLNSFIMDLCGTSVQSKVNFQSSMFYCRSTKDEFNYSQNPTAGTGSGDNRVAYRMESPTTFVTSVGLYDDREQLLAIGKLSQPFRKDFATEMNLRVRLDF